MKDIWLLYINSYKILHRKNLKGQTSIFLKEKIFEQQFHTKNDQHQSFDIR